jgi:hypothetical protein
VGTLAELQLLVQSGYAIIAARTAEEDRLERLLDQVSANLKIPLWRWTVTDGLRKEATGDPPATASVFARPDPAASGEDTREPGKALAAMLGLEDDGVFFLKDLHRYLDQVAVVRRLRDLAPRFTGARRVMVLCAATLEIPAELAPLTAPFTLELPTGDELRALVRRVGARLAREQQIRVSLSDAELDQLVERMRGLTEHEAERALTRAAVRDRALTVNDLEVFIALRRELLQREGALEYVAPEENLAEVGGFRRLKEWLAKRRRAFEPAAREFGLTPPKGILLLGVQGAGKTLLARAVAREWSLPLLKLEAGRLYDKFIGESEKNLERAIRAAEALAPCVLMIDEIEKAIGATSSDADAGLARRLFGRLLGWLQDRKAPVFVVATSNDIAALPPELTRKGRFDELFFIDLPTPDERKEILSVHLARRKRNAGLFDLENLAVALDGFSGAEIEQVVVAGLHTAFARGVELSSQVLAEEIKATRPLSVTRREEIDALRAWARDRTVSAS